MFLPSLTIFLVAMATQLIQPSSAGGINTRYMQENYGGSNFRQSLQQEVALEVRQMIKYDIPLRTENINRKPVHQPQYPRMDFEKARQRLGNNQKILNQNVEAPRNWVSDFGVNSLFGGGS